MTLPSQRVSAMLFYNLTRLVKSPSIAFLALSLAIMGPLLLPGHLITVDAPLALNWDVSGYFWGTSNGFESVFAATYNSAPIAAIHKAIGFVIPAWLVEKLWLVALFWLAGFGASRLPHLHGWGRYYAGILYAVNPFTYVRFIAGQWGILGAYALLPFAVTYFTRMLDEPRLSHSFKLVLVLTLIGFLQIHGLALTMFVLAVTYLFRVRFSAEMFRRTLPITLFSGVIFLCFNMFWIFRYATASSIVDNITTGELSFFAASPPLDVLSLRGFWLQAPYLDISDLIPFWLLLFAPIIFLAVYGGFKMYEAKQTRWAALALFAVTITGMLLSAGPDVPLLEPVFRGLWDHVPGYRAFRDSHKFVSLTAFGYAYLGAFSVQYIFQGGWPVQRRQLWVKRLGLAATMVVPIVYALPIFGAWGQLKPAHYPDEWNQVRSILDSDESDFNVLALPWNMYMDFRWLENRWNRLANPAPNFFHQPIIAGDNLEIIVAPTNSFNPVSLYMEELLERRETIFDFGNQIAPLNAKYIVLFEAGDSDQYEFLSSQNDLELVYSGDTISLYRNLTRTATVYSTGELRMLSSLEEYFDSRAGEDRLSQVYLLDSTEITPTTPLDSINEIGAVRINPVTYKITGDTEGYLVLVLPQTTAKDGWKHDGGPSFLNLNMMPVYPASSETDTIVYSRFYTQQLPLYALSLLTVAACTVVYIRFRNRRNQAGL